MFRSLWLRNVLDVARSRKDRRRLAVRSRKPVRLMLESLEARLTPSGPQTAGSYTDLVSAIAADTGSNTNYVIQITNSFTFNSGGQVSISKLGTGSTLTIEGQNGTNYTLTGNGNRLFNISGTGQNVTFADLTLTGGIVRSTNSTAQGGAIRAGGGNVTLSSVTVENSAVTGYQGVGGGIYVTGGGNLTIKNGSVIQSNNITVSDIAEGGGVFVWGPSTVLISDSTISKNSVTGGQGANGASPGASGATGCVVYGGGLFVSGTGWTVTLTGDTLSDNTLTAGNGGNGAAGLNATGTNASGGNGGNGGQGGVANGGGAYFFAFDNVSSHLTISDDPNAPTTNPSEFLDNSIQSGAGGNGGTGGTSTGTANNASGGDGGQASQAVGGGIFISAASGGTIQATINNTTFSGNKATGAKGGAGGAAGTGGSGSAGVAGTTQGASGAEGGGIAMANSVSATINASTVDKNSALANSDANDTAEGGGLYVASGVNLTMQGGSVIQSNSAKGSGSAQGGGVYVSGASTVTIADSTLRSNSAQGENGADGTTAGQNGGIGGTALGGGLHVQGNNWVVTLKGDTLSGNSAIGGKGGNGAAGSNATAPNSSGGNGGSGGAAGAAAGGAAYFLEVGDSSGNGSSTLKILNDPNAPTLHPSTMIGNAVQAGSSGNGGAGGTSTGTANNANGGDAGFPGYAEGGAVAITSTQGSMINATIGNTTFYGNAASIAQGATGGAAGTGGSGTAGKPGTNQKGSSAIGGGLYVEGANFVMVNSTVAKNTANGGAWGGGIAIPGNVTTSLENDTITQNTIDGGFNWGSGLFVELFNSSPVTLLNNLIQGNQSIGSSAADVNINFDNPTTLSSVANNFIGSMGTNIAANTSNIVGNSQVQLGSVVGVDSKGNPTGGPIYYPLLSGTISLGAGTTSVLSTIAAVEGTTSANATDEIGNPRSSNGSIDLGAVQFEPVITSNPTSQTVTAGANVSFTASASGATSVQWQVSSDGGKTFSNLSGATSTTLTLNNVTTTMNGYEYEAVFANSVGHATTSAATLTVNPVPPPPPPPSPPAPPVLNVPPLLALIDSLLGGTETVNANGTETITDSFFGIPLIVSTYDSHGDLVSVTLFGFNITFLFV